MNIVVEVSNLTAYAKELLLCGIRIKGYLLEALASFPRIDIYTARPANLEWNGLPVNASAGLEIGLIHKYALPWNRRSAG